MTAIDFSEQRWDLWWHCRNFWCTGDDLFLPKASRRAEWSALHRSSEKEIGVVDPNMVTAVRVVAYRVEGTSSTWPSTPTGCGRLQ